MKVGYARVSTSGQSLEAQLKSLGNCDKVFQEKISGADSSRPQLHEMLSYVRDGDVVVVTKLDRLARSTRDLLTIVDQIHDRGSTLEIQNINLDTSTSTGKLMLTMLGAIAEFERDLMLERQADGIERAKSAGKYKGRKPTAREKSDQVLGLYARGIPKAKIARDTGISVSSVYRILGKEKTNTSC